MNVIAILAIFYAGVLTSMNNIVASIIALVLVGVSSYHLAMNLREDNEDKT